MHQLFVRVDGVDHSAAQPDLFVFDLLLNRSLFLKRHPEGRKIPHAEFTQLCAERMGVQICPYNGHFPWGTVPATVGVLYVRRHDQCM